MEPATIKELTDWLVDHCYHFQSYSLNGEPIYDGLVLDKQDGRYVWYYTERGSRDDLNYFDTEQEAAAFVFRQISNDKYAKRHIVGFINDQQKTQVEELLRELDNRNIYYETGDMLYRKDDRRVMVFVYGCDINRALDLQEKYYTRKTIRKNG